MSGDSGIGDKRQIDFDDLQREAAGLDVGCITRFLSENDPRSVAGQKKKAREQIHRTLLDQLLQDAEYKALYVDLGDKLGAAERGADDMLERIEVDLANLMAQIAEMENDAARGPDGNRVFRFADGRVIDANGEIIPIEIADGIMWPDDAPSAEEYFATKQRQADLQDRQKEWSDYRHNVLGDVRERYDDADAPMSKDDMRDALDDIEATKPAPLLASNQTTAQTVAQDVSPNAFPSFN
ncbi:hypothetical protein [Ascidiaceihabitans sp.]|uniref:hypothetical protein n=1 Tax=Ascidiaceihabitans sp. TaxID=1872644 RepID=UPI0032983421